MLPSLIPALRLADNASGSNVKRKKVNTSKNVHSECKSRNLNEQEITNSLGSENEVPTSYIEFGTVIVYTCQKSCWSLKQTKSKCTYACTVYQEEQILLQSESV